MGKEETMGFSLQKCDIAANLAPRCVGQEVNNYLRRKFGRFDCKVLPHMVAYARDQGR
jgi:hypothetical protein